MLNSLKYKLSKKSKSGAKSHEAFSSSPAAPTRRPNQPQANMAHTADTSADAPPAYTAAPNAAPIAQPTQGAAAPATADDSYAFLGSFDTVLLIDDSGSMAGSRWRETGVALESIIPIITQHDANGIDVFFLNHGDSPYHHNVTSPATVREIFSTVRPSGGTPTGQRINAILKPYVKRCERDLDATKPLNLIVITDGEPSDDVESPLISAARKLDKLDAPAWQVGVQFFQVGRDEEARRHLKSLDDELADIAGEEIRDMVDTVPFTSSEGGELTGEGILKVVLGAVNRRLDRKKSKDLHR